MKVKVDIVAFHTHVQLGGGLKLEAINLNSKEKAYVESMEYDTDTQEVVITTTVRCPIAKGRRRRLHIPGSNVAGAWAIDDAPVPVKPKADKTGLVTA